MPPHVATMLRHFRPVCWCAGVLVQAEELRSICTDCDLGPVQDPAAVLQQVHQLVLHSQALMQQDAGSAQVCGPRAAALHAGGLRKCVSVWAASRV